MRRRREGVSDSSANGLLQAGHLSEGTLLEFLDDELSPKDSALAEAHLYSCWACRARREEISRGIAAIVEHQNAIAAPHLPPPPDDRRIFLARLGALSSELGHPSPFKRPIQWLLQSLQFGKWGTLVWASAIMFLVVSVFMFYDLRKPRVVSAKEFLDRATASETNDRAVQSHSIVIQKLRVQVNGKTLRRIIYRDLANMRVATRANSVSQDDGDTKEVFLRSSFGWESLLDPIAYSRWRGGLPKVNDAVIHVGSDLLRLDTSSPIGPVAEASLTVRTGDFHAIEEILRLRDSAEIQVDEESWDMVASTSLPPGIFSSEEPKPSIEALAAPTLTPARTEIPTDADLLDMEVEAQLALHNLGADLGEQIDISIRPDRRIEIDGVIADDARKRQLIGALQNIPYVRLELLTVNEAAAVEEQKERSLGTSPVARNGQPPVQLAATAPPMLESQLLARFPDKDERNQYVNQTLSLAQSASGRAWALNRLADQYPDREIALLNTIERDKLHMLLTDHISALREDTSSLLNQLGQILSLASNTPAANASVPDLSRRAPPDASQASDNWQDHIRRIHSSVNVVHESISALLAGSPDNGKENVDTIELNLRTALNRLQSELQISDQRIRKTIAAPRETNR